MDISLVSYLPHTTTGKTNRNPNITFRHMDYLKVFTVDNVLLARRGHYIVGTLILSRHHMVFSFQLERPADKPREIWICYPVIEKLSKARGSSWANPSATGTGVELPALEPPHLQNFDKYSASNIRIHCKDFTYYSFDFNNDLTCSEVYLKLSLLITAPKVKGSFREFYAYDYKPNALESKLDKTGWTLYDPDAEYERQQLEGAWRMSSLNESYRMCPSYPEKLIVPASISDSVLKHASKFRSKQRIPAIVYKHRLGENGNVIARCSQPLVGLNLQNRSIQDEKLIEEIFRSQENERLSRLSEDSEYRSQPQRNLIVDLRPITNAMAQHALGAGTENVENYRGKGKEKDPGTLEARAFQQVDKIFCNIDNIHVIRDSLNKLVSILSDLDKYPVTTGKSPYPLLQQSLTKTQWLHRLSIILLSVDRITKSVHLNNTNVVIHCSDGWDRTSQVSALLQLCLDPYFRTMKGFMVLVEKEWVSFGFKFSTRGDHGGCVGAIIPNPHTEYRQEPSAEQESTSPVLTSPAGLGNGLSKIAVTSFLQRAATHIKNTASAAASASLSSSDLNGELSSYSVYGGSNERSPVFHQFLDCVYQLLRQHPGKFEFNSRFLKRIFYHYYSCQYGTFLCDSERELRNVTKIHESTVSVWDYFLSRPGEFLNKTYKEPTDDDVLFFNYSEVKWWYELYGRSDEEMNGLSNSLDRKFAQLRLNLSVHPTPESSISTLESLTTIKRS